MSKKFEIIKSGGEIIAIIIRRNFKGNGMKFFTDENFPQQLAYVGYPKGKIIKPHIHNKVKREIFCTQEVDIIKKGEIKLDLYSNMKKLIKTVILKGGDIVMFVSGGHGYKILDNLELILIKQGPYLGKKDKTYIE